MRVAFVTVRPPYPLNTGGRIRTFHLLRQVSQVHDVTLVTATEGKQDQTALAAVGEAIRRITIKAVAVPPKAEPRRRCVQVVRSLTDPLPFTWLAYCDRRFQSHLRAALTEHEYEIVHCDHIQVAYAFAGLDTPPRLLNAHNIESVLVRRAVQNEASPWKRAVLTWEYARTIRAEAQAHRLFDGSVVVSEVDGAELQRISPGRDVFVVPNGVDAEWFNWSGSAASSPAMVCVGSMDWLPNIDGVRFFVREAWPLIRRRVPESQLWVVGRNPPRSLVRLCTEAGVQVTGTVDDVRPYMARARLIVVPLRIGGGTRLKILEAWSMRKPVLSTTIGAEGLPAVDGRNIALADAPELIAARAAALLQDANEAARLGAAGRRVVEEQFTWPRVAGRLLQAYEETVARAHRASKSAVVPAPRAVRHEGHSPRPMVS